ncbi:hypothetical protein UPYG_G00074620 [Umbra pygmaea]|uniref:Interleukin-7 n=1 Tax=Umbra pygmaea TaxID=75934 RepID=A0ABD0XCN3_UMBPY
MYGKRNHVARHLLGISVLSVMLLPLASSERITKVSEISMDFTNIIFPLLQHHENLITQSLTVNISCKRKEIPECEKDKEIQSICNMIRSHHKLIKLYELQDLISSSLDCPQKQRTNPTPGRVGGGESRGTVEGQGQRDYTGVDNKKRHQPEKKKKNGRRKRCKLKVFLEGLKLCYMSLTAD